MSKILPIWWEEYADSHPGELTGWKVEIEPSEEEEIADIERLLYCEEVDREEDARPTSNRSRGMG